MDEISVFKKYLKKNNLIGLALDIDETLSATTQSWFQKLIDKFGTDEKLSAPEMVQKYRYTFNVPYWQTEEVNTWIENLRHSNEEVQTLEMIKGASESINRINKKIPILAYITVRPQTVILGTKSWLRSNKFPEAEIIAKPIEIEHKDGNKWKAKVLHYLTPNISGIIDDNPGLVKELGKKYDGKVFLYDYSENEFNYDYVIPCLTWPDVENEIKDILYLPTNS